MWKTDPLFQFQLNNIFGCSNSLNSSTTTQRYYNNMDKNWTHENWNQQKSLASINGDLHNLKRKRPVSSDEDDTENGINNMKFKNPHFPSMMKDSNKFQKNKKVFSNEGVLVREVDAYAKNQYIHDNGSDVSISGVGYLFDVDKCKKIKLGSQKEVSAVEKNHQKEKSVLSFYYKMRQNSQKELQ